MQRWIIHVDMDAFYASVEQRDNPELQGKPVIVGGASSRGVVATASYEARQYGVRSAMPMSEARRRCPEGIIVVPNHKRYADVSGQIRAIMDRYSPLVEPLSLDEAFLDVTGMEMLYPDPVEIACRIKADIKRELELTASAGVAPNKFLAKLASDIKKPDGLFVIRPGEEQAVLWKLPVERLWGVGEVTAQTLKKLGLRTIGQVAQANPKTLEHHIGKLAIDLNRLANGIDDRPVVPEQDPKSVGNEETFEYDLVSWEAMETEILSLADRVGWRLRRLNLAGRTITVKIRFASFRTVTRSRTLDCTTNLDEIIYQTACELARTVAITEGVRLLGVMVSNLQQSGETIALFDEQREKLVAVHKTVDELKARFGGKIVSRGRLYDR